MRTAQAIVVAEHDLIAADLPAATGSSAWAPTAAASQPAVKIEPITPAWRVFEVIPQSYAVPVPPRNRCRPVAGGSGRPGVADDADPDPPRVPRQVR